jgi:hypothetical protein
LCGRERVAGATERRITREIGVVADLPQMNNAAQTWSVLGQLELSLVNLGGEDAFQLRAATL